MRHPSITTQRIGWIGQALAAEGHYGGLSALSQASGVPRQTLARWREDGRQALTAALTPAAPSPTPVPHLARAILTLLVEGHASYRGVQRCLAELLHESVSLGTISAVVATAGRRAQAVLGQLAPPAPCALALDELFGAGPQAAYLSAVDAHSGVVWGTAGPVTADADSWTLVLWELQAHGVRWTAALHDGGHAAAAAVRTVAPAARLSRDVWHVLHRWGQTQHRLERQVIAATARVAIRERYATTRAAGEHWHGRPPTTSLTAEVTALRQATALATAVGWLGTELRRLLAPVVVQGERLLDGAARRADLDTVVELLAEVAMTAPAALHADLIRLHAHVTQALPGLLTVAADLEPIQRQVEAVLGESAVGLLAWAWQRRDILGPDSAGLLLSLPPAWRPAARVLFQAWTRAARATSLAESWHALLRPHLAVHRTLPPALLAILAVWHNHRVVPRGVHAGTSPLQRSGRPDAPPDWLRVLGFPPTPAPHRPTPAPVIAPILEVAA